MNVSEAKAEVEALLQSKDTNGNTATIHLWEPESMVRVAEVSYTKKMDSGGMCGGSYMQSDYPHGIAVCALVERAILARVHPPRFYDEERTEIDEALVWAVTVG